MGVLTFLEGFLLHNVLYRKIKYPHPATQLQYKQPWKVLTESHHRSDSFSTLPFWQSHHFPRHLQATTDPSMTIIAFWNSSNSTTLPYFLNFIPIQTSTLFSGNQTTTTNSTFFNISPGLTIEQKAIDASADFSRARINALSMFLHSEKGFYSRLWMQQLQNQCGLISERAHVNNFSYATNTVIWIRFHLSHNLHGFSFWIFLFPLFLQ